MDEVMYDIMYYDYDGCGGSYENSLGPLRRTWEGAKKAVLECAGDSFEIGYEHGAPVAIRRSGRYAYEKIYIEVRTVED